MSAIDGVPDSEGAAVPDRFPIVGIGASAGGLESLENFFAHLPSQPGMAFVVVQHLSPDFRSMMDELLARHSDMPVQLAEHGEQVQPNRVYLLPPGKEIAIRKRRLLLTDKERMHAFTLPIDRFFYSLAEDAGPDAVGIILSGSGSDGSRGIRDIKRAGGRVYVESPDSAQFDGMPLSAMATGLVDGTGPARDLSRFLTQPEASIVSKETPLDANETSTETILRLLRDHFGLDFSMYKTSTVSRRILRRVELVGLPDLAAYADSLQADTDELSALYHDLLIGVTQFFRDPEAFELLEDQVVPEILRQVPENEEIRVWVAGCATGEEAYSLAMIFFERLMAADRPANVKILSTDVHSASLVHASAGLYGAEQMEHVSDERRERFFRKKTTGYQVSSDLRQLIVFAPHNVTKDAPFTKLQLVSCRNLLIYLEPSAQRSVLSFFHFGLARDGFLFLGSSETPGALAQEFDTVDERTKLYRKRRDVKLLEPLRVPLARKSHLSQVSLGQTRSSFVEAQLIGVYDQLLDKYMPPSFLVNEERQLIDSFGGAERLFKLSKRRPSMNILDLLEGDLRTVVAGAIQRALKNEGSVRYTGVPIPDGSEWKRGVLSARVFLNPRTSQNHVLISIEADGAEGRPDSPTADAAAGGMAVTQVSNERLVTLEGELSYTRETLQSTIEELQTSNEELQATNEELVASNEELQSTNEELHSVNEELYTVNAELQKKVVELRELNSDMQHFLESTDVGILFLDRNLGIRKYTPRVASVFHIEPQDMGRSIRHFSYSLRRPSLLQDIESVLHGGDVIEDEVRDKGETTFFLRIMPYKVLAQENGEGRPAARRLVVEGVVLSLIDISALARAQARLAQLSAIVESSQDAIVGKTLDGVITTWNGGAQRLYGYTAEEVIGRHVNLLAPPGFEKEVDVFLAALRRGEAIAPTETSRVRKDGSLLDISVSISPIYDAERTVVGASAIGRDITALKKAQQDLAERETRIRLLLDSTAEAILGVGTDAACIFVNGSCLNMLGYSSIDQVIGRGIHDLVHGGNSSEDSHDAADCPLTKVLRTGEAVHTDADVFARFDKSTFISECWSHPVRHNNVTVGLVVTFLDNTERKRAEDEIRTAARRREEFLAMLSHELRNPLSAVMSATQVIRSPGVTPAAAERARQVIVRQARHMGRMLDDLLDVSRITRGGIELHKEDLDLGDVIHTSLEALDALFAEKSLEVTTDLGGELLSVRGDGDRLQQVIVNLLSNAVRYSPPGKRIWLTARIEGDSIVLTVKDEGRGIAPSMLSEIFELFVQNEQGLERSSGGLGIGLTLVRKIVELHGGTVVALSDGPGTGSTFVVTIPYQRQAVPHKQPGIPQSQVARRILVVEDQDDAREMMCFLLSSKGHVVLESADGMAAIETIEREHPDIALVDIGLPVLTGYDVARKVRENPVLDDVVLVALTGYGREQDVRAAKAAGFDEHLTKPADPDLIDDILRRCVRRQVAY